MGFVTGSDPLLKLAVCTGIAIFGVSVLLLVTIALLRGWLILRRRREERVVARWRPILLQALEEPLSRAPGLNDAERVIVIRLWLNLHETLRGPVKDKLNKAGLHLGFTPLIHRLLRGRNVRRQLLGIRAAGMLRDAASWDVLSHLSESANPVVSLAAVRSLIQLDVRAALERALPRIVERTDWPLARLAGIFSEAGADQITQPLASAAMAALRSSAAVAGLPRLLRLVELADIGVSATVARAVLQGIADPDAAAAALRLLHDPDDVPMARAYCTHADWRVRVQAANALRRLGTAEDRERLISMLSDSSWWVRYRAAQALASLPLITVGDLRGIREGATDRFTADMLGQVIAERIPL